MFNKVMEPWKKYQLNWLCLTYKGLSHSHLGNAPATCRVYQEENCQSLWSDLWWTSQSMKLLWRWPLNAWPKTFQIFQVIWNRLSSFVSFPTDFCGFPPIYSHSKAHAERQRVTSHIFIRLAKKTNCSVGQVCLPANALVHSEITMRQIRQSFKLWIYDKTTDRDKNERKQHNEVLFVSVCYDFLSLHNIV